MSEPGSADRTGPDEAHLDVAGWVLGVLDAEDAERFADHLDACAACRQAVRELQPVRGLIGTAAPPVDLPPGLAARTLRAVELAAVRDLRRRRTRRWLAAVAATLVLLAAGGVAWVVGGLGPPAPQVTVAMTAPYGGAATGHAVGHDTPGGWSVQMSVSGLEPIPEGQGHYECWYVGPDDSPEHPDAVSAGSFEVNQDGAISGVSMWTVVDLQNQPGTQMIVTREPDNNPARTGPVVLAGPVRQ